MQNRIKDILSVEVWKSLLWKYIKFTSSPLSSTRITDTGECVAKEVFKYKDPDGYFAMSPEPRSPRPPNVAFRVGQVIKHKKFGYRGVIVGWDKKTKVCEKNTVRLYLSRFRQERQSCLRQYGNFRPSRSCQQFVRFKLSL